MVASSLARRGLSYAALAFVCGWVMHDLFEQRRWLDDQLSVLLKRSSSSGPTTWAASSLSSSSSEQSKSTALLPDWRMTTDCSAYSRDCVLKKLSSGHRYAEYPFRRVGKEYDHLYEWESELPEGWEQSLENYRPDDDKQGRDDSSSPNADTAAIQECVRVAQDMSVSEQLDNLLAKLKRELDMVSFTISDYNYARDMMHDVFEMAHNIVGFRDAFFMVAMDVPTMELACQYNYPFLAWPQEAKNQTGTLKRAVANSKFDISYELVKRGQSFFFFEMDLWFVSSPKEIIEEQTADIVFSGHQNNPQAANIGLYLVVANKATEEYFRLCIEILEQSPETHDQVIMQQIGYFVDDMKLNRTLKYGGWFKEPLPKIPTIQHPVVHERFSSFQVVADTRPVPSESTFAIHPLCGVPLRPPHGKKMVAKELGAWYGSGSYYGKNNRYLWFDGHAWNGFSMAVTWPGFHPHSHYHDFRRLQWTVAVTVALARRTGRIWVMPKILNDWGVYFIWFFLDMESVEELVDVRETNFPANPKAWHSPSDPLKFVARTALGHDGRIFAQNNAATTNVNEILAWDASKVAKTRSAFDAWFAIHTALPSLYEAEVLLAGMPAVMNVMDEFRDKVRRKAKLSIAEAEIKQVWEKLRWCGQEWGGMKPEKAVGSTEADLDCYGRGSPASSV